VVLDWRSVCFLALAWRRVPAPEALPGLQATLALPDRQALQALQELSRTLALKTP